MSEVGAKYRAIFGFLLLVEIGFLAAIIGLGHVEKETSYGLEIILGCFTTLAGGFATWAFGSREPDREEKKDDGKVSPKEE